jgi:hypothetical protein
VSKQLSAPHRALNCYTLSFCIQRYPAALMNYDGGRITDVSMTNPAASAEGRTRFENVQSVRQTSPHRVQDLDSRRAVFSELIGKPVRNNFLLIPPFSTVAV